MIAETGSYIQHRLRIVGWNDDPSFADGAFDLIHRHTGGVPRRINTLCARLFLFGYLDDIHHFDERVVLDVVRELDEEGTQLSTFGDQNEYGMGFDGGGEASGQMGYEDALESLARRVAHLKNAG